jgi:hypothetical protein
MDIQLVGQTVLKFKFYHRQIGYFSLSKQQVLNESLFGTIMINNISINAESLVYKIKKDLPELWL